VFVLGLAFHSVKTDNKLIEIRPGNLLENLSLKK